MNISSRSHLRRADQLLTVNGRSVEHMSPHEVIQLIQSSRVVSGATTATTDSSVSTDEQGSAVNISSGAGSSLASVDGSSTAGACTIRLLVVFNPVRE